MMRGPRKQAMVVRTPDGLVTKVEELKFIKDKYPILGLPFIRGVVNFGGSMSAGVRAIFFAVDQLPEDQQYEQESKFDRWLEKKFGKDEKGQKSLMTIVMVIAIAISVGLFILLPTLLAGIAARFVESGIWRNIIEGVIRVVIFLGYLAAVSKMPDIRRVFSYHGAEHKTIFCYEQGLPLTVENVRPQQKEHPRCGTSFLFVVMIVSIIVFSVVTWSNPFIRMALRLVLLPVVVAISYEFNRIVGRHSNKFTSILSAPGRWMQKLTVYEPYDSMIEVAITALELVIPEVQGEDKW
jgi:uncharacterized protein YqhQ